MCTTRPSWNVCSRPGLSTSVRRPVVVEGQRCDVQVVRQRPVAAPERLQRGQAQVRDGRDLAQLGRLGDPGQRRRGADACGQRVARQRGMLGRDLGCGRQRLGQMRRQPGLQRAALPLHEVHVPGRGEREDVVHRRFGCRRRCAGCRRADRPSASVPLRGGPSVSCGDSLLSRWQRPVARIARRAAALASPRSAKPCPSNGGASSSSMRRMRWS